MFSHSPSLRIGLCFCVSSQVRYRVLPSTASPSRAIYRGHQGKLPPPARCTYPLFPFPHRGICAYAHRFILLLCHTLGGLAPAEEFTSSESLVLRQDVYLCHSEGDPVLFTITIRGRRKSWEDIEDDDELGEFSREWSIGFFM